MLNSIPVSLRHAIGLLGLIGLKTAGIIVDPATLDQAGLVA